MLYAAHGRIYFLFETKVTLEQVFRKEKVTEAGKVKPEAE